MRSFYAFVPLFCISFESLSLECEVFGVRIFPQFGGGLIEVRIKEFGYAFVNICLVVARV